MFLHKQSRHSELLFVKHLEEEDLDDSDRIKVKYLSPLFIVYVYVCKKCEHFDVCVLLQVTSGAVEVVTCCWKQHAIKSERKYKIDFILGAETLHLIAKNKLDFPTRSSRLNPCLAPASGI